MIRMINAFSIALLILFTAGCGSNVVLVNTQPAPESKKVAPRPDESNVTASTEHLKQAKMFYARDKYKQALQHCEKAIEFDHSNWEAHLYLGLIMQQRHDYSGAIEALNNSLKFSPDNRLVKSDMHAAIGYCWENLGNFEKANREYDKSLSFNPGNQNAREGQNRIKVEKTLKNWGKDKNIRHEG